MGCGASKFASNFDSLPVIIRPLLGRRLEEIRIRLRNGAFLRNSPTRLSKKKLLKDGSSDHPESDGKSISSEEDNLKVSPASESDETPISNDVENDHKAAVKEAPILSSVKVAPALEPEKFRDDKSMKYSSKDEDKDQMEATPKAAIIAAVKSIKTTVHNVGDEQGKGKDQNEEEDNDDIRRFSSINADGLFPGSPSFRVYFIESLTNIKDDDELVVHAVKDEDSDKKSMGEDSLGHNESQNSNEGSETKTKKKAKRRSTFRKVISTGRTGAVKNLINVKSCYNPLSAGHHNARLLGNKADD